MSNQDAERIERLRNAIATLEDQQRELGLDHSSQIAKLQEQLKELTGDQPISQRSGSVDINAERVEAGGDIVGGDKIPYQTQPLPEALQHYLDNLIDSNQHLRLHSIRAGGQPISIDSANSGQLMVARLIGTLKNNTPMSRITNTDRIYGWKHDPGMVGETLNCAPFSDR